MKKRAPKSNTRGVGTRTRGAPPSPPAPQESHQRLVSPGFPVDEAAPNEPFERPARVTPAGEHDLGTVSRSGLELPETVDG